MQTTWILLFLFTVLQAVKIKPLLAAALPDASSFSRQSDSGGGSARYGTRTAPAKCHGSICSPADGKRRNRVSFPKQEKKAKFSRKYNAQGVPEDSGFVPVLGPYGKKPTGRRAPRHRPAEQPRAASPKSRPHAKLRSLHARGQQPPKELPVVLERPEELSARESRVAEENILGNGHFEIIRGGMFSDLEENEIAGSRRTGRGGHYDAPRQSNYNAMQNFQFPRYYMNRGPMAPYHPMFFPRAALSSR